MVLRHVGKALVLTVIVFIGVFLTGCHYEWPQSNRDPITIGFDKEWKIGSSDIEVGTIKKFSRIIPMFDFEYNGTNYTTCGNAGLPANLIFLDEKDALINANGSRTFQKFYTKKDAAAIYALYAIVEDNNVYYAIEKVYEKEHYELTLEQKDNKAIIDHRPSILSFVSNWLAISFGAGLITLILTLYYTGRNKEP